MGHGKSDRPFLSAAEHSGIYGAHSSSTGKTSLPSVSAALHAVTFDCCALSFQAWRIPVCSPDNGVAFELTNLVPFLRKYSLHPITGKPFSLDDVVRLNFHKNDAGRVHDPVSFKEFGSHSHLVAIRQSGNVFLWDTVQRLNIKAKYMKDLLSDEAFKREDIITLQDPERPEQRDPRRFWHVKQGLRLTEQDKGIDNKEALNSSSAQKVLSKLRETSSFQPERSTSTSKAAPPSTTPKGATSAYTRNKATGRSTGMTAASFTSSSLTPRTSITRVELDTEELMFTHLKSVPHTKAYVRLATNLGPLNIELHCDRAPKTCYNFLQLCKAGKYTDTIFHRNMPGFMIQGGDPTGTGRGGSSIWSTDFRDEYNERGAYKHDSRGVVSMANKGAGTNASQFFITYRAVPHLDGKHTVFGRLMDGERDRTLLEMEAIPSETGTDRPVRKIKVTDVLVTQDPFERYKVKKRNAKLVDKDDPEYVSRLERKRRRDGDRTTWLGTELSSKKEQGEEKGEEKGEGRREKEERLLTSSSSSIGKYLNTAASGKSKTASNGASQVFLQNGSNKRKGNGGGFGDFSGW
ncbi:Peptidyl-prolyl cis-trans isomerase-like 2 [Ustilago sp. UG-2017a]|nr:Peptidyl-prolyl cis-trans isomerase-like 2 [Ustilago sp. UG-2017a]